MLSVLSYKGISLEIKLYISSDLSACLKGGLIGNFYSSGNRNNGVPVGHGFCR